MKTCGPKELLEDVHQGDLCVACGACVALCPYFGAYRGRVAMLFPCDLKQGRCYAYCPKTEVDLDALSRALRGAPYDSGALGHYRSVLAARAGEQMTKGRYQSGGTVSALVAFALKAGVIKAAILTDREGLGPVPRVVERIEDVIRCATSKYTAAPTLEALNRAVEEGRKGLGVVGTPCQITAVSQLRRNPMERQGFEDPVSLTIGLFCTWALDMRKVASLLSEKVDVSRIKKMDIPPPPAEIFRVETEEETLEIPLDEIRPAVLTGCGICPDMTSEWADISVGVLEGEEDWNTVIVRSEKGAEVLNRALEEGWILTREMPEAGFSHLEEAARNKKVRGLKAAREQDLLNASDETRRSAVRLDPETVERIMGEQGG